jgi:ATP-binding cassette subfamily C (CFTR/MRP) protein 1
MATVNLPQVFISFFIFAGYAIEARIQGTGSLSVSQAITSLAVLNLVTSPLAQLLYAIPSGWAALGCFARIQEFLLENPRTEQRSVQSPVANRSRNSSQHEDGHELQSLPGNQPESEIRVEGSSFGWSDSESSIVKDVTTSIRSDTKLTIVVGPVGCGKSTFLKGLLGETAKARGEIFISSSQIAYCDQTPWIINGSIRENIVAASQFDELWYQSVIQACALDIDLQRMPSGDSTVVGSKGVKLSGGQKQRLVSLTGVKLVQYVLKSSLVYCPRCILPETVSNL